MQIKFYKFHGTGNDFVLVDNRENHVQLSTTQIAQICHRRFGIGADGLMLLQNDNEHDFKMIYYNSDGNQGSMCGNGGRCIVAFAKYLGIIDNHTTFVASDGLHHANISNNIVSLQMIDVMQIKNYNSDFVVDTGSPHYVKFIENIDNFDVVNEGRKIRNSAHFIANGINVNFIEYKDSALHMRTYERGVEDETYSCGTGAVAAALVAKQQLQFIENAITLNTLGGKLFVSFNINDNKYTNIILEGAATMVFDGIYTIY